MREARTPGHLLAAAAAIAVAFSPACSSEEAAPEPPSALEVDTGIPWNVVMDPRFGTVAFAEPREPGPLVLTDGRAPTEAAFVFLEAHRAAPRQDLVAEAEGTDPLGLRYASLTPRGAMDIPSSTRLTVHFDGAGRVAFTSGRYASTLHGGGNTTSTKSVSSGLARSRPSCFHFDGSGKGVHFYAPPPLRDANDEKHFEVSRGAQGGYEMRRDATASSTARRGRDLAEPHGVGRGR